MSSVIINNVDFDIFKIDTNQFSYKNTRLYGIPNTEIEIFAETSINNLSLLQNWQYRKQSSIKLYLNGQNIELFGVQLKNYSMNFQSNSNINNIDVILSAEAFSFSQNIRELRKEKLEKLNEICQKSLL